MITKKMWFKSKRYGWGWTPASWEGWSVMLVYVLGLLYIFKSIDGVSHSVSDTLITNIVPFVILTSILIGICYLTGEKPRFRWGN